MFILFDIFKNTIFEKEVFGVEKNMENSEKGEYLLNLHRKFNKEKE